MGEGSTTNRALKREHSPDIDLGSLPKRARTADTEPYSEHSSPPPPRAPTPTLAAQDVENERPRDLRRRQTAPVLDLTVRLEQLPFPHIPTVRPPIFPSESTREFSHPMIVSLARLPAVHGR